MRDFDRGLAIPALRFEPGWAEYTILIKQAAGALGQHRLALDLHGRWPADREWVPLLQDFATVADLMEQGLIPPFALEYFPGAGVDPAADSNAEAQRLASLGTVRLRFLALLFRGEEPEPANLVASLILFGGGWGVELGKRFLESNRLPMPVKLASAQALVEAGVFAVGQPIPILHEGQQREIAIKPVEVKTSDPDLERRLQETMTMRVRGDKEAAFQLLSDRQAEGPAYPPAMMARGNMMWERGAVEGARSLYGRP